LWMMVCRIILEMWVRKFRPETDQDQFCLFCCYYEMKYCIIDPVFSHSTQTKTHPVHNIKG
jgi:hypothetical protein